MKDWLYNLITPIVSNPEGVKIEERTDEKGLLLTVQVDKVDMGTVIGKQGKNLEAIRLLTKLKSKELKASIIVLEPYE